MYIIINMMQMMIKMFEFFLNTWQTMADIDPRTGKEFAQVAEGQKEGFVLFATPFCVDNLYELCTCDDNTI